MTSSEPEPVITLAACAAFARPIPAAWIGLNFARPRRGEILSGIGCLAPSGGCKGLTSGIGIGIGIFDVGSWITITKTVLAKPSKLKLSDSTFDEPSEFTLSAGCGGPVLISGPQ